MSDVIGAFIGILLFALKWGSLAAFCIVTILFREKPYVSLYLFLCDLRLRDRHEFIPYGFWLYCGLMGSGKTISMAARMIALKKQYPDLYIVGNFRHNLVDKVFNSWEELLDMKNPKGKKYGLLVCFDEIHLTMASDNWKSAPDNLLEYISMRRKEHTLILASSQVFTRVNVKLREQTNYIIECKTLLGRWTFNKAFLTEEYAVNGDQKDSGIKKRHRAWRHNFIQTKAIRDSFDTYELLTDIKSGKKRTISLEDLEQFVNRDDSDGL